jgi:hypothetical protein
VEAGQSVGFVCHASMGAVKNLLWPIDLVRDDSVVDGEPQHRQQQQPYQQQQWGPPPPPMPEPTRVEIVETTQFEEPLGEEVRVIDNRQSGTGVMRNVKASREWVRTVNIGAEQVRTLGGELGIKAAWLTAKGHVEQELHRTYSTEHQTTQIFAEEVQITVPARTSVRLVLRWKRIWQKGFVRLVQADGSVVEVPFQVVVNVTFDQFQQDAEADRHYS